MTRYFALLALVLAAAGPAVAADLSGTVSAGGSGGAAVVYLDGAIAGPPLASPPRLTNHDKKLVPGVLPVLAHQPFEIANDDDLYHNTYSLTGADTFDVVFRHAGEVKTVTLDKPGKVDAFCRIHRTMHAVILVLENPYFAVADAKGKFSIKGVPKGAYTVKVWHELLGETSQQVTVGDKDQTLRFELKKKG